MNWHEIVDRVTPYIVRVETPGGHGTGFVCLYNDSKTICGIATARHVIAHAEQWQQPIRVIQHQSNKSTFAKEGDRVILIDRKTDSAVILLPMGELKFPEQTIPLRPTDDRLPIGAEVAWLGFPAIGPTTLCFFSGNVSAWQDSRRAYLIDGVSINGVSGGPVIYSTPTDGVQIVGSISAYIVNRATGEALPGLSVAQDVSHFHAAITHVKSIDEAEKKKQATEQTKQEQLPEPQREPRQGE
jgi:hypothetical protein